MNHRPVVVFLLICFAVGATFAVATAAQNVIVNPGNAAALSSSTGLTTSAAQNIINQASVTQVQPEINIPANGASLSGNNIVIKGIATPGATVDIVIKSAAAGEPTLGTAESDQYGVWSYTLAPTLTAGSYTVQATTQAGAGSPLQSAAVQFSVSAAAANSGSGSGSVFGLTGDAPLIIILAIIVSITFIVVVIVVAVAPYMRGRKAEYVERMKSWEAPELASMDDAQWNDFVMKMNAMRHYIGKGDAVPKPL
jgi:preprotein translocase subunit SecG